MTLLYFMTRLILATILFFGAAHCATAGLYSDEMAKCLIASTTQSDKTNLVRWLFATAALHPDVSSIAAATKEQRAEMNISAADS
jgi:hypothetical protein